LKLLLAHNFYGSEAPSGENTVYEAERDLLRAYGHKVVEFTRQSDDIRSRGAAGLLQGALATPWNPFSAQALRRLILRERPDVVHAHNTFPLISPSIFSTAHGLGVPVVLTLHNYRTFCAAGIPMRDNRPCTQCMDQVSVLPALRYRCYRGSRLATLPLAVMIALHRGLGTWQRHVDTFIALTSFQRDKLVAAGLPAKRVHLKPHFYAEPPTPLPWPTRESKVVYVGRLGPEKGLNSLIEAWRLWGAEAPPLELIGDGPERELLERSIAIAEPGGKIALLGQLSFAATQARLATARLLVLPSLCYEGFPMAIREAFALGVPVAGSRLGSIPCIVADGSTGVLFTPGDAPDLLRGVRAIWRNAKRLEVMAAAARAEFEDKYTADRNYAVLMEIYAVAIALRNARRTAAV
jgi:glycosyltransferase involved in cell wall biosynthesis